MVDVWWMLIVKGKYVSYAAVLYTYSLWMVAVVALIALSMI